MVGFEMLAQVQRDLTAERVCFSDPCEVAISIMPCHAHLHRLLPNSGHFQMSTTRRKMNELMYKIGVDLF